MSSKKYYWLKLRNDFFSDPKIKKLRKIAGGDTYTIILQKIMLLSIRDEGVIKFQGIEKTLQEELALILDEDVSNVEIALSFMNSTGLIEPLSDIEFLLPSVPTLIGAEGNSAERMRKLREKKSSENQLLSHCDGLVTKSDTEKEKREKRKELEKDMGGNAREGISDKHKVTPMMIEEFIKFRMNSGGIKNPVAFEKTLLKDLADLDSMESKKLAEWIFTHENQRNILEHLAKEFKSIPSHFFSRKDCRERAKDDFTLKMNGIKPSDILIEIAFQEVEDWYRSRIGGAA